MKDHKNQSGLGMKNIQSRIDFLNGGITIDSAINKGVKVVVNF